MEIVDYRAHLSEAKLYGILDMGYVVEGEMLQVAEQLLVGGVDVLQLRAKGYDEAGVLRLLTEVAPSLLELCRTHQIPLIINDFPKVAATVRADGVHIGQDDGNLASVRRIVGEDMIVGRSTHSVDQAIAAVDEGFDYIGFGPLFPTPTKKGRPGIGLDAVSELNTMVDPAFPVFCIGGVVFENLELILDSGAKRVVIVSALLQSEDLPVAARGVKKILEGNPRQSKH